MKKAFVLIFIFALAFQANAQTTFKPGIRAGANFSTLLNTNLDNRTDFYVGGLLAIKFAKHYTLQPEINYSRQGAKGRLYDDYYINPFVVNAYPEESYSIQYININAINKFYLFKGFHAMIGPSFDIKIADNFGNFEENVEGVDIGVNFGLGYTLPMGLTIETRVKLGTIDIFGNDDDYYENNKTYADDVVLNSTLQVGLSYTFKQL